MRSAAARSAALRGLGGFSMAEGDAMKKVERDGKIAVLYSPGFGAGWSTWSKKEHRETLCMDADIVQPFLDGDKTRALAVALEKFPNTYTGGFDDLEVEWIDKGKQFEIEEYDGSESVHVIGGRKYFSTT